MNRNIIFKIASEVVKDLPPITNEMLTFFKKRTKEHIDKTIEYAKKIAEGDERFDGLIEQAEEHDSSKYENPEYIPYIYLTWKYKCKSEGKEFTLPKILEDRIDIATEHHVRHNPHHPEHHGDYNKMSLLDIGEMVADWCAMSKELGVDPKEWADNNIGKKWNFNEEQSELIYSLIDKVWI